MVEQDYPKDTTMGQIDKPADKDVVFLGFSEVKDAFLSLHAR